MDYCGTFLAELKDTRFKQQVHGTRAVQKFVEEGVKRSRSDKIMASLVDHVEPLSRSVTGNFFPRTFES